MDHFPRENLPPPQKKRESPVGISMEMRDLFEPWPNLDGNLHQGGSLDKNGFRNSSLNVMFFVIYYIYVSNLIMYEWYQYVYYLTWNMLLYHITVVIIDLTCPAILDPYYHSGGWSQPQTSPSRIQVNSELVKGSQFQHMLGIGKAPILYRHPVGNQEQPKGARNIPVILTVDGSIHIGRIRCTPIPLSYTCGWLSLHSSLQHLIHANLSSPNKGCSLASTKNWWLNHRVETCHI